MSGMRHVWTALLNRATELSKILERSPSPNSHLPPSPNSHFAGEETVRRLAP